MAKQDKNADITPAPNTEEEVIVHEATAEDAFAQAEAGKRAGKPASKLAGKEVTAPKLTPTGGEGKSATMQQTASAEKAAKKGQAGAGSDVSETAQDDAQDTDTDPDDKSPATDAKKAAADRIRAKARARRDTEDDDSAPVRERTPRVEKPVPPDAREERLAGPLGEIEAARDRGDNQWLRNRAERWGNLAAKPYQQSRMQSHETDEGYAEREQRLTEQFMLQQDDLRYLSARANLALRQNKKMAPKGQQG